MGIRGALSTSPVPFYSFLGSVCQIRVENSSGREIPPCRSPDTGFVKTDTLSVFKHTKAACADFPLSFPPVPGNRDPPRSVRDVGLQVPSLGCPRLFLGCAGLGVGLTPPASRSGR